MSGTVSLPSMSAARSIQDIVNIFEMTRKELEFALNRLDSLTLTANGQPNVVLENQNGELNVNGYYSMLNKTGGQQRMEIVNVPFSPDGTSSVCTGGFNVSLLNFNTVKHVFFGEVNPMPGVSYTDTLLYPTVTQLDTSTLYVKVITAGGQNIAAGSFNMACIIVGN